MSMSTAAKTTESTRLKLREARDKILALKEVMAQQLAHLSSQPPPGNQAFTEDDQNMADKGSDTL
jgi:hypothetical protein